MTLCDSTICPSEGVVPFKLQASSNKIKVSPESGDGQSIAKANKRQDLQILAWKEIWPLCPPPRVTDSCVFLALGPTTCLDETACCKCWPKEWLNTKRPDRRQQTVNCIPLLVLTRLQPLASLFWLSPLQVLYRSAAWLALPSSTRREGGEEGKKKKGKSKLHGCENEPQRSSPSYHATIRSCVFLAKQLPVRGYATSSKSCRDLHACMIGASSQW